MYGNAALKSLFFFYHNAMIILDKLSESDPRCRPAVYLRTANMHADPMIPFIDDRKGE